MPLILLFTMVISFNQSCGSGSFGLRADSLFLVTENLDFTYNLKKPTERHYLPYVLEEISGLTYKQPNQVLAVDDESGKVFEYDLKKRDIVHSIDFYKADDYEGVELVGDTIFILKYDGDLFRITYSHQKKQKATKFENELDRKNDTEGLGYDASREILLIACKEEPDLRSDTSIKGRAFYGFDIASNALSSNPLFVISPHELESFWEAHRDFDYEKNRIKFKPSAIATHPISGNYYILSSVGKMLVVTDKKGTIKGTYPVAPRILGQPEGICFAPNGDLFISSEGEGDRGYILKFTMQKAR